MPASGKRKTTMAKLARERRLQERRLDKQARKEARRMAAAREPSDGASGSLDAIGSPSADEPEIGPAPEAPADD